MVDFLVLFLKRVLIAVDQLLNTICLGSPDETLSARAYRLKDDGWNIAYLTINLVFFWQSNHCQGSYNSEVMRKHLPEEYRKNK